MSRSVNLPTLRPALLTTNNCDANELPSRQWAAETWERARTIIRLLTKFVWIMMNLLKKFRLKRHRKWSALKWVWEDSRVSMPSSLGFGSDRCGMLNAPKPWLKLKPALIGISDLSSFLSSIPSFHFILLLVRLHSCAFRSPELCLLR